MLRQILRKESALEDITCATSEWVLFWAQRMEAQKAHKKALDNIIEDRDFDSNGQHTQRCDSMGYKKQKWVENCEYCWMGHLKRQCLAHGKTCGGCRKANYLKTVCRFMKRQQQDQKPARINRSIHDVRQDEEPKPVEQDQGNRSFDSVKIKYLKFDNVKSIIFTKLESSTSQEGCA